MYRWHFASYLLMVIRVMNSDSWISQTAVSMWLGDLVPVSSKCHDAVLLKTPSGLNFIWTCRRDILICFSCFAISRCWNPYLKTKKCFSITVIRWYSAHCRVTFWSVVSHLCTFLVTLTLVGVYIISSTYQQRQAVISSEPQVSHFAPRPSERDGWSIFVSISASPPASLHIRESGLGCLCTYGLFSWWKKSGTRQGYDAKWILIYLSGL